MKAWTYENQPGNDMAYALGLACRNAAADPKCGDEIDRGLILLKHLQAIGYGIVTVSITGELSKRTPITQDPT